MNAKEFNEKLKSGKIKLCDFTSYDIGGLDTFKPVFTLMKNKRTGLNDKIEMTFVIKDGEVSIKIYTYDENGGWTTLNVKPKTIRQLYSILKLYNQERLDNALTLLSYLKENLTTMNYYKSSELKQDNSGLITDPRVAENEPYEEEMF